MEFVQSLIDDRELPIHRILSKDCVDRDAVAGSALRLCHSLIQGALQKENLWKPEMGKEVMSLLWENWQNFSPSTPTQ
jgi:hypothetical protein